MLICDNSTTHKNGKMALDIMLAPYALCWQEMVVLLAFDQSPDVSQTLLTLLLQTDKGNVSKLMQRMEDKGFLIRQQGLKDKRRKKNELTQKARDMIPSIKQIMQDWEDFCLKGLTKKKIQLFKKVNQVFFNNTMALIQSKEK